MNLSVCYRELFEHQRSSTVAIQIKRFKYLKHLRTAFLMLILWRWFCSTPAVLFYFPSRKCQRTSFFQILANIFHSMLKRLQILSFSTEKSNQTYFYLTARPNRIERVSYQRPAAIHCELTNYFVRGISALPTNMQQKCKRITSLMSWTKVSANSMKKRTASERFSRIYKTIPLALLFG